MPKKKNHPLFQVLTNRRGANTVEYVIILAAALILATSLYVYLSGEGKQTVQEKIKQIFAFGDVSVEVTSGGDGNLERPSLPALTSQSPIPSPTNLLYQPQDISPSTLDYRGNDPLSNLTQIDHRVEPFFPLFPPDPDQWGRPTVEYDREQAVKYAHKWSDENERLVHPDYERFDKRANHGGDCANFVSQCLVDSGLEMNEDWYYEKRHFFEKLFGKRTWSSPWAVAHDQYEYFSNPENGYAEETITITSPEELNELAKSGKVKPGDLLYWDFRGEGHIEHSTIITSIEFGKLKYSGHTTDRVDADVISSVKDYWDRGYNTELHIVRMKDRIPAP